MSLMGVDIGTTAVKAVVFDEMGTSLAGASREYPLLFPFAGAAELDSHVVMDAALAVIADAANQVRSADPVAAIGIASQGEAFTAVSQDGRMLSNIMTSSDTRAAYLVDTWASEFGVERLYEITGHTAYPMYSLLKLLWLREHEPRVWERAWKLLFCEDLLAFCLTGETRTDRTMAARSMMYDVRASMWSAEILDRIGLSAGRLPDIVASGEEIGTVRPELARDLHLKPDAPVVAGGHDQPVGAFGCGAAAAGVASYSIGTVECVCPAVDRLILNADLMRANLATYPHVTPDTYTTVAFNMTGGSVLKWVRDNLALQEAELARQSGEDPYDRIIASAAAEPGRVILLPHFGPTGTPHFDPHGTGVLLGITLSTSRAEVLRAFLEGITYEMKWNLAILAEAGFRLSELRAVGGGAKSGTWMQIKADILGMPLTTMRVSEATCMGAAMLAGGGVGAFDPREASLSWAVPIRTYAPREEYRQAYEDRFGVYKDTYNALAGVRGKLQGLTAG